LASHYDVLGVARSADGQIIRAAYRVLVKRYHPDVASGAKDRAAARFRRIQEAYEVLSDARRRVDYDAQLDAATRELQTAASPTPNPGTAAASIYWRGVGYLLIILSLGGIIEIIGVWVIGMIGGLEAPRPPLPGKQSLSPGTVLHFDNKGNLIEIVPGTSPASLATVERDSWRHEWWCAQPEPYYDKEATIKCNNQRREWCAYHPADLSEYDQGVIVRNDSRREWCARHPADP